MKALNEKEIRAIPKGTVVVFVEDVKIGGSVGTVPKGTEAKIVYASGREESKNMAIGMAFKEKKPYSYPRYKFLIHQLRNTIALPTKEDKAGEKPTDKIPKDEFTEKAAGLSIASFIGASAGAGYAFYSKRKFWGYVGFALLGSLVGSIVHNIVAPKKTPPKEKEERVGGTISEATLTKIEEKMKKKNKKKIL